MNPHDPATSGSDDVMDFDPEAQDHAPSPVSGKSVPCPVPDAPGASPPTQGAQSGRRKSLRLDDGGIFLRSRNYYLTEFFFEPYINASRRFWRWVENATREVKAGRTPNYAEVERLMELKREFAWLFGGANILHPAVSAAANPHLRRHDFPRLRDEIAMVSPRAEAIARLNPQPRAHHDCN